MGGSKQKERTLRQVNIDTGVQAVSENMNTISSHLTDTTEQVQGLSLASPVMKKINAMSAVIPAGDPTEAEVINAHDQVGLTLAPNSKKHPKRVKRAAEKRGFQRDLRQLQSSAESIRQSDERMISRMTPQEQADLKDKRQKDAYKALNDLDLSKLMDKKGGTPYEKLLKNYQDIKKYLNQIPDYERELKSLIQANPNPSAAEEEKLNHSKAKLKALYDIRAYYDVYERLMGNKYYAMLPHEEMHKLSYRELRVRLQKLYADTNADHGELIDYYQNLIRLRVIGLEDGKSAAERETQYFTELTGDKAVQDKRKPKEELEKMTKAFLKMQGYYDAAPQNAFVPADTRKKYKAQLFDAFSADIDKFRTSVPNPTGDLAALLREYDAYKQNPQSLQVPSDPLAAIMANGKPADQQAPESDDGQPSRGITLSPEQKAGVKLIGSWILRHAYTDWHKHPSFAHRLLDTKPEQQLLIFYLVETGKQEGAMGIDFFSALNNYQPDLEKFKSNAKWENISRALRTSIAINSEMKQYGILTADIKDNDNAIAADKAAIAQAGAAPDQNLVKKQLNQLVDAISKRGVYLRMLYRNAGLDYNMPPDMAEDPVLRAKMFAEYKKIGEHLQEIKNLNKTFMDADNAVSYNSPVNQKRADRVPPEEEGDIVPEAVSTGFEVTNEYIMGDVVGGFNSLIDAIGQGASKMTETAGYGHYAGWSGGLAGLLAFAGAIVTTVALAAEDGITAADRTAQALSVSGNFLESSGNMVMSAGALTSLITGTGGMSVDAGSWLGKTATLTGAAGDVMTMVGGGAVVIAGAVKSTAALVEMGRINSSKRDIKRARTPLANKPAASLTDDEKRLQRFLDHEERETDRKMNSAGVSAVAGIATMASGLLLMTGFLAPIAGIIGLGALALDLTAKGVNRYARNKNRRKAVDEAMNISSIVDTVLLQHPDRDRLMDMDRDDLTDLVRDEAAASLGFSSYHECFRHICREYATMLYNKVFVDKDTGMYLNAMKSLGMKIVQPAVQGDPAKPSIEAMVTKMMS